MLTPSAGKMRRNKNEINLICFAVAPPFPLMDRDENNYNY